MKVTIHGPFQAGAGAGRNTTYVARASDDPANSEEPSVLDAAGEIVAPTELEVSSREDVIDTLYPAEEFQREPDDLPMYLADVFFGESLADLPETVEESDNQEGESAVEYTDEQKAEALSVFRTTKSMRAVGRKLEISASTAKKVVAAAEAEEAAKRPARARRSTASVPVTVDPNGVAVCKHCSAAEGKEVTHPTTVEYWYVKKADGTLHTGARCKKQEAVYRAARRGAKAPETPSPTDGASTNGASAETPAEVVVA